ncbi:unnamed protein product [Ixodes pacificus]
MASPKIHAYIEFPVDHTLFDVKWIPHSAKCLALGRQPNGRGLFRVYEMSGQRLQQVHEVEQPQGIKCGTFGASSWEERNIATADFKGQLCIWDLEDPAEPVMNVKAHRQIINSIDGIGGSNDSPVTPSLVTGSKDGKEDSFLFKHSGGSVKVWDPRQTQPAVVMEPLPDERRQDCWAVTFGNAYSTAGQCVCAGYENGDVKLFDIRNFKVSWETCIKSGVCSIEFDQRYIYMNKLVVTSTASQIDVFDMRTRHPEKGFARLTTANPHGTTVWTVRHLPQDKDTFATTNGDGSLSIWKYCYPEKRASEGTDGSVQGVMGSLSLLCDSKLSSQPITGFDWNPHMPGLFALCALDQTLRIGFVAGLGS